jgi:tetratricopeptide (TPR) repeat protein
VPNQDFPRLGITVRRLLRVVDGQSGGRAALAGLTTDQVKDAVFVPITAETQLSLCEQLQSTGDEGVGIATWFVSHAWIYLFLELVEALESFFAAEPQGLDTCVWLDLVSTSQHGTFSRPPEWWATTFQNAIQSMGNMVMVMSPWDKPVTLTRAWCILELYACCSSSTPCRFEVALPNAQQVKLADDLLGSTTAFYAFLECIDSQSSECSRESDRQSIFAAVRSSVGFAALDAVIRRTLTAWIEQQLHLRIKTARAGNDECEAAKWLDVLGGLRLDQGMYEDALALYREAVEIKTRVLGHEHEDCLTCKGDWALAHKYSGQHSVAAALEEQVLDGMLRVLGNENEKTFTAMNNLAGSYVYLGDYSRAIALFRETLSVKRRVLGAEHADTLLTHGNPRLMMASPCSTSGPTAPRHLIGYQPNTITS